MTSVSFRATISDFGSFPWRLGEKFRPAQNKDRTAEAVRSWIPPGKLAAYGCIVGVEDGEGEGDGAGWAEAPRALAPSTTIPANARPANHRLMKSS